MEKELGPIYKASDISITFSGYRTPGAGIENSKLPKRFCLQFSFFTFAEQRADNLALVSEGNIGGRPLVQANTSYFL